MEHLNYIVHFEQIYEAYKQWYIILDSSIICLNKNTASVHNLPGLNAYYSSDNNTMLFILVVIARVVNFNVVPNKLTPS